MWVLLLEFGISRRNLRPSLFYTGDWTRPIAVVAFVVFLWLILTVRLVTSGNSLEIAAGVTIAVFGAALVSLIAMLVLRRVSDLMFDIRQSGSYKKFASALKSLDHPVHRESE